MKTTTLALALLFLSYATAFTQVAINNDNSDPDPSAMLDVKSTTMGVLVPRMTAAERDGISDPAPGCLFSVPITIIISPIRGPRVLLTG